LVYQLSTLTFDISVIYIQLQCPFSIYVCFLCYFSGQNWDAGSGTHLSVLHSAPQRNLCLLHKNYIVHCSRTDFDGCMTLWKGYKKCIECVWVCGTVFGISKNVALCAGTHWCGWCDNKRSETLLSIFLFYHIYPFHFWCYAKARATTSLRLYMDICGQEKC